MARKSLKSLFLLSFLAFVGAAHAQGYPNRPLRMVIPQPAGGAVDAVGRIVAQRLSDELKQPVVVENRPGASSTIGTEYTAKQPADGYTIHVNASIHTINPFVLKEPLRFDPVKDFTAISLIAVGPVVMLVNPAVGAANVQEFIARARATPDKMNFATSGFGSAGYLATEFFRLRADLMNVPIILYKGTAPAMTDLLSGQVSMMMDPILSTLPQVRAGKLKALAIAAAKRSPLLPDVPTLSESGLPGLEFYTWYGLWAPAGLPAPVLSTLEQATVKFMNLPEVRERFTSQGFDPIGNNSAAFTKFIADEAAKYSKIVKDAKIVAQ